MKPLSLFRPLYALAVYGLLAGCGGSQSPIGTPGAMPQSRSATAHRGYNGSGSYRALLMRPTAKRSPRIFFSAIYEGDQDRIFILTYPQGKYVTSVNVYLGTGLCTDYRGNVWVAEYGGYAELSYDGQISCCFETVRTWKPTVVR